MHPNTTVHLVGLHLKKKRGCLTERAAAMAARPVFPMPSRVVAVLCGLDASRRRRHRQRDARGRRCSRTWTCRGGCLADFNRFRNCCVAQC
jgi:hypothetical protein